MNRKREAVPEHSLPPQEQILTYWGRFTKCPYETVQKGSLLFLLYLFLRKEALQDGILSLLGGQAQRLQL